MSISIGSIVIRPAVVQSTKVPTKLELSRIFKGDTGDITPELQSLRNEAQTFSTNASNSADSALVSANTATTKAAEASASATTAITQAGISTTKAAEAEASANAAAAAAMQLPDYAALRAYTGTLKAVYITGYMAASAPSGIAGYFTRDDSDTTSSAIEGMIIIDTSGRRWKRRLSGAVNVLFFGADPTGAAISTAQMQAAINSGFGEIYIPDGRYKIDASLIIPDNVKIIFSENAVFLASVNNLTFFKSTTTAYFSSIHNARLEGNGKTGVIGFDMTNFRLNSGIYHPYFRNMETGFIGRVGCFGTVIDAPTALAVNYPINFLSDSSGSHVRNPNFDNSSAVGGSGNGVGVTIQPISLSNLGVTVSGGFIQGFGLGVLDNGYGTKINDVYFEVCTIADISGDGSRGSIYSGCNHWGNVGAAAYKLRNSDMVSILNPTMASGGRTALYDIDSTNTNCTELRQNSAAYLNTPTGSLTYVDSFVAQKKGTFLPTISGSGTAGSATYTVQAGKFVVTGTSVTFHLSVSWTGHTGTGNILVSGLPISLTPSSFASPINLNAYPRFAFSGIPGVKFSGSQTQLVARQLSTTGSDSPIALPASGSFEIWGSYEI